MATRAAKAIRASEAHHRIDLALGRLAKRLDVEEPAPAPDPVVLRDPELRAIRDTERLADRIEALDAALKDEGYSAAPGETSKQDEATGLSAMTRKDLNAHAADLGIERPDKLPNKTAVIAAIEQMERETSPDAQNGPETGASGEQD